MATDKKSFILYCDLIGEVDHLTDEEKGKLFQHLLEYVNDMNPVMDDRVILGPWKHIQNQLKRDLVKYEGIKEKRSEAGKASAEKRKQKATKSTSVKSVKHRSTNPTVNDTVTVTVNGNVIKETKEAHFENQELNAVFLEFIEHRKQMKEKMTDIAISKMKSKLSKSPVDVAINMLNQSIENGWKGIFDVKKSINDPQSKPTGSMNGGRISL